MENKQHVQVPNNMGKSDLTANDLLVYVSIKRYMNNETKTCFPSQETICKNSGLSKPTILKSIDKLKQENYITVYKEGRKNVYKFNPHKNFEPFSYEFLDNENLTSGEKAYVMITQQFMFKDEEGIGKVTFSNKELGEKINMSHDTIERYDKKLEEKGYLTLLKTNKRSIEEGGIIVNEKFFHLDELGQAIIWTLQKHETKLVEHEERITSSEKTNQVLLKELDKIKKQNKNFERVFKKMGIIIEEEEEIKL